MCDYKASDPSVGHKETLHTYRVVLCFITDGSLHDRKPLK